MLLNTHGQVKLCDFGVSVQLLTSLTKTFIGTNAYMAVSYPLLGTSTLPQLLNLTVVSAFSHLSLCSRNVFLEGSTGYIQRYGV